MFNNTLMDIFKLVLKQSPHMKSKVSSCNEKYKEAKKSSRGMSNFVMETIELLDPHIMFLAQFDENIFSSDYGDLILLPGMNFKKFWNVEMSDTVKDRFWNYFQKLYIAGRLFLDPNSAKKDNKVRLILENLQLDKIVEESVKHDEKVNPEVAASNSNNVAEGLQNLKGLFEGNNIFAELTTELQKELPGIIGNNSSGPLDMLTGLFSNGGEAINKLVKKMGDTLDAKLNSGEITPESMYQDAMNVTTQLQDKIPGMKLPNMPNFDEFKNEIGKTSKKSPEDFDKMLKEQKNNMDQMLKNISDQEPEMANRARQIMENLNFGGMIPENVPSDDNNNAPSDAVSNVSADDDVPSASSSDAPLDEEEAELENIKKSLRKIPENKEI